MNLQSNNHWEDSVRTGGGSYLLTIARVLPASKKLQAISSLAYRHSSGCGAEESSQQQGIEMFAEAVAQATLAGMRNEACAH
jgi:hypothetical protein